MRWGIPARARTSVLNAAGGGGATQIHAHKEDTPPSIPPRLGVGGGWGVLGIVSPILGSIAGVSRGVKRRGGGAIPLRALSSPPKRCPRSESP